MDEIANVKEKECTAELCIKIMEINIEKFSFEVKKKKKSCHSYQ